MRRFAGSGGGREPTCFGKKATLVGAGVITGTSANDVIVGSGGDDVINALGGDDRSCALDGVDRPTGGPGDDLIDGGGARDFIAGDLLRAAGDAIADGGDDLLLGGDGDDACRKATELHWEAPPRAGPFSRSATP